MSRLGASRTRRVGAFDEHVLHAVVSPEHEGRPIRPRRDVGELRQLASYRPQCPGHEPHSRSVEERHRVVPLKQIDRLEAKSHAVIRERTPHLRASTRGESGEKDEHPANDARQSNLAYRVLGDSTQNRASGILATTTRMEIMRRPCQM